MITAGYFSGIISKGTNVQPDAGKKGMSEHKKMNT
jgi:hypothetical protein